MHPALQVGGSTCKDVFLVIEDFYGCLTLCYNLSSASLVLQDQISFILKMGMYIYKIKMHAQINSDYSNDIFQVINPNS